MVEKQIVIKNKLGLHARASAKFVSTASRYQSAIEVKKDSSVVNGKSIMGIMTLGAVKGSSIILCIEGPDEEEMETALVNLIENNFGESE